MFSFAILIGVYGYLLLALGLANILYKDHIIIMSITYLLFIVLYYRKLIFSYFTQIKFSLPSRTFLRDSGNYFIILLVLFIALVFVNMIGAMVPELAFDALWYHLTIPKIYLSNHSIFYIPGNLLYYSAMPRLGEMLYILPLASYGEILAKIVHLSFGLFTSLAIYKLSRKYFEKTVSILAVVIFYSNLVVSWQSTTAYVDLIRSFFELIALWGFINWWETKNKQWLVESGVILGLAVSTKIIAVFSLLIFSILIIFKNKSLSKKSIREILILNLTALVIVAPWFIFAYIYTGNPVFPILTNLTPSFNLSQLVNPIRMVSGVFALFTSSADPISPIYLILLPLILINFKKLKVITKLMLGYSLIALLTIFLIPTTDQARFYMPYLPAFSIVIASTITIVKNKSKQAIIGLIILLAIISFIYRSAASYKYFRYILRQESKEKFLSTKLNFSFGDFYDTDGFFAKKVKKDQKVLLYGFHNLYYVNFPFIHSSWVKKGDRFNYVAVQGGVAPDRFKNWNLIYKNDKTYTKVYSLNGTEWIY